MGFVYFELEGVDYLLVSKEEKSNNTIKTSIIDYESYNWLESRYFCKLILFLEKITFLAS